MNTAIEARMHYIRQEWRGIGYVATLYGVVCGTDNQLNNSRRHCRPHFVQIDIRCGARYDELWLATYKRIYM